MSRAAHAGLLLLLVSSSTLAEPTTQDRKRAAELATESAKHYKRGEFEVSVALLRKAYAYYPEPNLLYNLARALEGMGDKRGAVDQYTLYLSKAKRVDDRGAIERRVALLERELAEKSAVASEGREPQRQPQPQAEVKPQVEAQTVAQPEPANPSLEAPLLDPFAQPPPEKVTPPSKLPLIPIGVGAAVIGAGVSFGLHARDYEEQARNEPIGLDAAEDHAHAVDNARIANIMFVTGGAVLAAGIVWEVFVLRAQSKKSDAVTWAPRALVSPRGIALEWTLP